MFSSPAVAADGTIYFGGQNNLLHALTPDGRLKWSFRAGSLVFSSPALDAGGNIYFGSSDRQIYSVSPEGKLRWVRPTGLFVNASPIVTSGNLVVVGSYDGHVYAVKTSGEDAWVYPAGAPVAASAAELSDGTVVVGDLSGTVHAVGPGGQALWKIATGKKIDTPVAVSDQGSLYFSGEGGALNAIQKGRPLADGPWTSFRNAPTGWGRVLTPTEAATRTAAKRAAATAVLAGQPPRLTAPAQTPPTPTPPTPVTPPPAPTLTPEQYAQAAGQSARTLDGQVYLPLRELTGALGTPIRLLTPRTATLTLPAGNGVQAALSGVPVPVRYVGRAPFVPLAALADLPGVKLAARRAAGVAVTLAGRTVTLPLNVPALTPLRGQPEYPALIRRGG